MEKIIGKSILLIVIISSISFLGCVSPIENSQKPQINFYTTKENFFENEEITFYLSAKNTEQVIINFGTEKKVLECNNECEKEFKEKLKAGAYSIEAQAIGKNDTTKVYSKIYVKPTKIKCSDGTENNNCSEKKPYYCENGSLKENCLVCGCEEGYYCNEGKCNISVLKLKKIEADFPNRVTPNSKFVVKAIVEFDEQTIKGTTYYFSLNGNEAQKYIFDGETEKEIELTDYAPKEGTIDISIVSYANENKREIMGTFYKQKAIIVESERKKLDAPTINGFAEGKDIILSWNKIEGAVEYRLYKSLDANPIYISYKLYKKISGNETSIVLQNQNQGGHYFVLTAINAYGEESLYSNVFSVEVK
ncbi:MAG: hypothetical protein QXZ13_00605 [Candidatus Diapherotrites archaeon]